MSKSWEPHTAFYEMTSDKHWATGVRITSETTTLKVEELTGNNCVGLLISKIKKELMEEEDDSDSQSDQSDLDTDVEKETEIKTPENDSAPV